MKKIFMVTMLLVSIFSFDANAESISEAICKNHEQRMEKVILMYRKNDIPINIAKEHWNGEDNFNLLFFLWKFTEETYKDPDVGKIALASGRFFNECVKIHRGY